MFTSLMNDRSFYYCYESLQLKRTATPDVRLVIADGDAVITDTSFTPNRIDFTVLGGGEAATRVLLNQNYAPGWRSDAGAFTPTRETLPGVTLAPGQTGKFSFRFVPDGLWAGLGVFAAAAGLSVLAIRPRQAVRT